MRHFVGKHTFLTGAASGIGRSLALKLAAEGANLFLVDVDEAGLERVRREAAASGVIVVAHQCDLTCRDQVSAAVQRGLDDFGVIDLLVNNAGVACYGPTHGMTAEQWDWLLGVNLLAPIQITRELLPTLMGRPDAHIVNMCSVSGLVAGGRFAAYHVSKFGLIGFTEALRAEYGRRGLGVSAICPGPSRTGLYANAASSHGRPDVPVPPEWLCATPEKIADRTINAIYRNKRMVLITPMAHGLYNLKRFAPGVIDAVNTFSRRRILQRLGLSGKASGTAASGSQSQPEQRRAA